MDPKYSLKVIFQRLSNLPDQLCKLWKSWGIPQKTLARLIIYTCLGMFAIFSNPFGFNSKLELMSQETVAKILSPWYPFGENKSQEKLVILLVNSKSLDLTSQLPQAERIVYANEWPILYKDHSNIIKTIVANSSPKQVFIDIEFHKIRNTDKTFPWLLRVLEKLNQKKDVQFLHAIGGISEQIPKEINQQFSKFSQPVINAWSSDYMPLVKKAEQGKSFITPALQMYANLQKIPLDLSEYEKEMFVYWKNSLDNSLYKEQSLSPCTNNDGAVISSLKNLSMGLLGIDVKEKCYPHKVVYLDELQQMVSQGANGKKKIKAIFDDATVLYGTDYIALGDRYNSPTHGTIPGIFYHAMALENLLEFNKNYFKSFSNWVHISLWATLSFMLILIFYLKEKFKYIRSHQIIVVLILVAYLVTLIVLTLALRLAPANIIGLFGLMGVAWYLSIKESQCSEPVHCQSTKSGNK